MEAEQVHYLESRGEVLVPGTDQWQNQYDLMTK
jgi:hypothetical protein